MTKRTKTVVLCSIFGLLVVVIGWLFLSDRVSLVIGQPKNETLGRVATCGGDIVSRYNDAMFYRITGESSTPILDEPGLKVLETDIRAKKDYKNDPTCQTILFWIGIKNEDYDKAKTAYDAVKKLYNENSFANSNLRSNAALFQYDTALESITPSDSNQNPRAGGNGG